jgi:hypothetical protein
MILASMIKDFGAHLEAEKWVLESKARELENKF